jgi:hypothetical protein
MTIRPFRDYSEHEVLNLFALDGEGSKGMFVTAVGSGFDLSADSAYSDDSFIDGTVSSRFDIAAKVTAAPSGSLPKQIIGMTLKDVKSVDENGYPLKFEPSKAAERDVVISGQAVPLVKRGIFLYSGIEGAPSAGNGLAVSDLGDGSLKVVGAGHAAAVGRALGPKDANGFCLIEIKL